MAKLALIIVSCLAMFAGGALAGSAQNEFDLNDMFSAYSEADFEEYLAEFLDERGWVSDAWNKVKSGAATAANWVKDNAGNIVSAGQAGYNAYKNAKG